MALGVRSRVVPSVSRDFSYSSSDSEEGDAPFRQALQELLRRVVAPPGVLNLLGQQIAAVLSERDERLDFIGLGFDSEVPEQLQVVPGGFRLFHGWSSGRVL